MASRLRTLSPRLQTTSTSRLPLPPKETDPHYHTPEHRKWRAAVIARAQGVCQGPNHDPRRPRTGVRLFADHIREIRDGGNLLDPDNGMALCGSCHTAKTIQARAARMREIAKD